MSNVSLINTFLFLPSSQGVLAIKYIPYSAKYDEGSVCLLGEVASDFKTTMKELESRNVSDIIRLVQVSL